MEEGINLNDIVKITKKYIKLIIGILLFAISLCAIITFFVMTPQYEGSTQILVNQAESGNEENSTTDVESSRDLINTYNVIITSPAILEPVKENSNFEGSIGELRSKVEVSSEEDSQVATITVNDPNPQMAVNLANILAQTFEQEISNIMEVDNVSILSEAQLADSETPVSPQPTMNFVISIIIGLMIGIGIALLIEFLDKTIKSESDIEKELKLPILGTVPVMSEEEFKQKPNGKNSRIRSQVREKETS